MTNKHITTTIVIAIIVGAVGFAGGMQYQKTKKPGANGLGAARGAGAGAAGARRFGNGTNNFVSGTVLSQNGQQITIQMRAGGSRIVILPASAQIGKFAAASTTDISVGSMVTVTGTDNSDGSMTAQTVQVRPASPGAGQGGPAGSPGPGGGGGQGQGGQPGGN